MKLKGIILSIPLIIALLDHATAQAPMQPATVTVQTRIAQRFPAAGQWLNQNNLSITTSLEQAFIDNYIVVASEGLPSPAAKSPAKRRLTAEKAATAQAYLRLAEFLDGVAVVGDTMVKDAVLRYDVVRTAVNGFVKGAQVVFTDYNAQEEVALVVVKVKLRGTEGFGGLLYEKLLGDPNIKNVLIESKPTPYAPISSKEEGYDGLIIDATEHNFRPALINRVFTPKGEILYDPSKISQKVLVDWGCGEYTNTIEKGKAALDTRGVKRPLIIKAIGTVSPSDLQVSNEDVAKISSANQKGGFLASAKVAFVLK